MLTDELLQLIDSSSGQFDDDEPVDNRAHALQCAALALADGADDELVVAALFHDVGYHPSLATPGVPHEVIGARFAQDHFGPRVSWLIAQHVPAKRYLVATNAEYANGLSPASVRSLERQGGPMRDAELAGFRAQPWAEDAARLRRWDDLAKVPGAPVPALADLRALLDRVCVRST